MERARSPADRFFESKFPLLFALIANGAIFLTTILVISLFPRDPNIPLQLANSPSNFPLGTMTAAFTPDTQVFLNFSSWPSWYLLTLANFVVFLSLFAILNWRLNERERGIRLALYFALFLILPVIANLLNLVLIGQSTLGPSGSFYASVGAVTGFGLVNLWTGDRDGGLSETLRRSNRIDAGVLILNGAIGTGFLALSFFDPSDFFSESQGAYLVGYGIHMFCFYSAVLACLCVGYLRRKSKLNSPYDQRSKVDQSESLDD